MANSPSHAPSNSSSHTPSNSPSRASSSKGKAPSQTASKAKSQASSKATSEAATERATQNHATSLDDNLAQPTSAAPQEPIAPEAAVAPEAAAARAGAPRRARGFSRRLAFRIRRPMRRHDHYDPQGTADVALDMEIEPNDFINTDPDGWHHLFHGHGVARDANHVPGPMTFDVMQRELADAIETVVIESLPPSPEASFMRDHMGLAFLSSSEPHSMNVSQHHHHHGNDVLFMMIPLHVSSAGANAPVPGGRQPAMHFPALLDSPAAGESFESWLERVLHAPVEKSDVVMVDTMHFNTPMDQSMDFEDY